MSRVATARWRPRGRARHDDSLASPSGIVAIIGRPNTGKSTLFNRLTGSRRAIVDELSGLTRDRLYGIAEWRGRRFTLVDTAGLDARSRRDIPGDMAALARGAQQQARLAIQEADVCCFVLDIRDGVTPLDDEVAKTLRGGGKPVLVVGNKADSDRDPHYAHELHGLGLGEPMLISALQGRDTGDLLDAMVDALPPVEDNGTGPPDARELRVAIIGRPNTGKSSLLNALVGEERALVSPVAGTTRDAVDTVVAHDGRAVRLVDTAGLRRRGALDTHVERYSVLRALRALERSDVGVLVIDASQGVVAQDRHVAGYAVDAGAGLVITANKWDLVPESDRAAPAFLKTIGAAFDFVPGVPVLTLSATQRRNIGKVLDTAAQVATARATRIPTGALNQLMRGALDDHPPQMHKGRQLKVFYATQARSQTPTIVLFVNDPQLLHFSYSRYLENRIRSVFGFAGVRLRIVARQRSSRDEG